jgi:hypothetical protein
MFFYVYEYDEAAYYIRDTIAHEYGGLPALIELLKLFSSRRHFILRSTSNIMGGWVTHSPQSAAWLIALQLITTQEQCIDKVRWFDVILINIVK